MTPYGQGGGSMDEVVAGLARLVLAACGELAAGGEAAGGLELLPLEAPESGEWRLAVGPPRRERPELLLALAHTTPTSAGAGAALAARLARLAADTRLDARPLFGIRDDRDEPAAAVLLPLPELAPDVLAGHLARLAAAMGGASAAAETTEPAAADPMRKGWMPA